MENNIWTEMTNTVTVCSKKEAKKNLEEFLKQFRTMNISQEEYNRIYELLTDK